MKRKLAIILILTLVISFSLTSCVNGTTTTDNDSTKFVTLKAEIPEDIPDNEVWQARARFVDSKKPITLSLNYDGFIHATVPVEYKDRKIEAFLPEEIKFTDLGKYDSEYNMESLAKTGVILGDEEGRANITSNVTRAEAIAMIVRFLGIDDLYKFENEKSPFEDVLQSDWFYNAVMTGYNLGIVEGTSATTFSSYDNVTKEELTVFIARAITYADLRCPFDNGQRYELCYDADEISDWALEAYKKVGYNYLVEYDYNSTTQEERLYLHPQKAATRRDAADIIRNVCDSCQTYPSQLAEKYGFDKEMPAIDGSTSTYPFTQSVYTKLFYYGTNHLDYPKSHSKSHASYKRLIDGEVDMIFASVYPATDILEYAKQNNVELELIPIAYDAMIFFTNMDNSATNLTKEQITEIYVDNKYENWKDLGGPDALLYPYCRNNDSGSHAQMEKHFLNGNEINEKIRQETTSVSMSNVLTDVIGAKTDNPKGFGLGYSIFYYFRNMDMFYGTNTELKLLSVDGVAPSDETIANGTYPLSNNTYIAIKNNEPKDSPARKMAEFMLTEAGQECVEMAGFGRLDK